MECFEDSDLARHVMFKPFTLIDLTVLSDEEIKEHGLAALMEALLKHSRDKKFLTILRRLLKDEFIQSVVRQIGDRGYFKDMLAYIANKVQAEEPEEAYQLIEELAGSFPEDREAVMTLADLLREEGRQAGIQKGMEKGRQVGWEEARCKLEQRLRVAGSNPTEISRLVSLLEHEEESYQSEE